MSQVGYSGEWLRVTEHMEQLVSETKGIQPSYFYLEIQRRKERGTLNLRWRARGHNGSSLVFQDPRMQQILASLPIVLQRKYAEWELQKVELNQQAKRLRLLLSSRVSRHRLKQLELV